MTGATSWHRDASALSLLLAGVAINSVCSALILLVLGLSGVSQTFSIARWLIGSLDAIDYRPLVAFMRSWSTVVATRHRPSRPRSGTCSPSAKPGPARAAPRCGGCCASATSSGSVLAALTVAVTGPIGFIGLVVPHLVRMRVSADDRVLMPCAFFLGGVLLASCDALGRVLLAPAEIPAGAITACIGGPYLVWLVRQRA